MIALNKRLILMLKIIAGILCIPLIAMQFTSEVNWKIGDFIVMGIMLSLTAIGIDFILRKVTKVEFKLVYVILVIALFLITWAELAVGIFS